MQEKKAQELFLR